MITLEKATFADCELFNKWETDAETIEFLSIEKNRAMETTIREFLDREKDQNAFDFVVLYNGEKIGRAYLSQWDKNSRRIDITRIYIGDKSYKGKGLGRVLLSSIVEYCFNILEVNRISLDYLDGNPAQKLYESLGFVKEGVFREMFFKDGRYYNYNLMSILKKEWQK